MQGSSLKTRLSSRPGPLGRASPRRRRSGRARPPRLASPPDHRRGRSPSPRKTAAAPKSTREGNFDMIRFLAIALAASLATAAYAQPAPADDVFTASVRAGDLNLASPGGLATLRGRVKAVADRYCGVGPSKPLLENAAISRCHAELQRSAASQVALALGRDTAVAGTR